jgi:hypothetical protein
VEGAVVLLLLDFDLSNGRANPALKLASAIVAAARRVSIEREIIQHHLRIALARFLLCSAWSFGLRRRLHGGMGSGPRAGASQAALE